MLFSVRRTIRFFFQRRRLGFDESELWNLDLTCAQLIAPRIRAFIDTFEARSVPCNKEQREWRETLEKMYTAFQLISNTDGATYILTDKEQEDIEEGLDLFREYFFHLWD
jgi:hypothetical protein